LGPARLSDGSLLAHDARRERSQSIPKVCELVHSHLRSSVTEYGSRRAQAMIQQPAKGIPQWLTIDLLVIVGSLAMIGVVIVMVALLLLA
jgi:hypothetical protein